MSGFSNIEANRCAVRDILYSTSMKVLVPSVLKYQENNTEIQALLDPKHQLHRAFINAYNSTRRKVQI